MKQKVFSILALLLMAVSGAWAQDYYAPSTDEVIILNDVYDASKSGCSSHSAIAWGGSATVSMKTAGDPNNGGQPTSSTVNCYSVKGNGQGKNITLSITGVSKVIVYYKSDHNRYIELRDGSKNGNIIGSGQKETYYTEVELTATNKYSIFLHGTSTGSDDQDVYVYAIKLIAAPATTYSVTLAEGTEDAENWDVPKEATAGSSVTATYKGDRKVKSVKAVKVDPLAVPLTIEAIAAGSINVSNPKEGMQYSLNGGAKTAVTTSIDVAAGDKVQFYGNGTSITSYSGTNITGSGDGFTCKVYGNIMSLVDEENFATAKTLSANSTFSPLFSDFTTLTDASGLLLPATTLANYCYQQMFQGCTALTAAPELPATQLASGCYYGMFISCSALTAAPELPATQLASGCYYGMFIGCSALTAAPELPATQLTASCYYYMFSGCSALTAAPELPATQLANSCYYYMFLDCSALTAAPALPATQLAVDCYNRMFMGCSALTAAPALPAETLVSRCYYRMFYQCSMLATVTCLATSGIGQSNSTSNWLNGAGTEVQGTKTVYTVGTANWPEPNINGIPNGWTRVNVDN